MALTLAIETSNPSSGPCHVALGRVTPTSSEILGVEGVAPASRHDDDLMPAIDRLAANPRLKDVAFLCVSVEEDPSVVGRFTRQHQLNVPVYLGGAEAPAVFQTEGIPATFIVDRAGKIVAREIGSAKWDDDSVVELLEKLAQSSE